MSADKPGLRKRSVLIAGHATSVSLEPEFWRALKGIAESRGTSINRLIEDIDQGRQGNLSSAIRVFVLKETEKKAGN
jgi:predicted DNA-binding ribbon-helix-helix protein